MKTSFLFQVRTLLVTAVLPLIAAAAESPSLLLQKGIYAEEIERNLDSAIKIYEQIAAEAAANRTVVAQAQYRLAVCYQKKGNKEQAIKLLNELVLQLPADPVLNQKARETLTQLGAAPSAPVSMRKVASLPPGWFVAASPDGRLVEYQATDNPDVSVYEIAAGRTRVIAKGNKDAHVYDAAFSADGESLAYTINGLQIWVARVDGTMPPRKLLQRGKPEARYSNPALVWTIGWSPDGSQLIVGSADSKSDPVVITAVDVKSGSTKEVARVSDATRRGGSALSSNGQFLALRKGSAGQGKIVVVDLKTGREETLVETPDPFLVGWSPGDTKLAFNGGPTRASDQLWAVTVAGGKKMGEPAVILGELGTLHDGLITRDGSVYYSEDKFSAGKVVGLDLWVVEGFLTRVPPRRDAVGLAEILGPNNTLFDAKSGFAARVPTTWKVARAARPVDGPAALTVNFELPVHTEGRSSINVWKGLESVPASANLSAPNSPAEVDAWLRKLAESRNEKRKAEGKAPNYSATKFNSRMIGNHRALSWTGEFGRAEEKTVEQATLIYSEKSPCFIQMSSTASNAAELRTAYESLVESVRLP